MAPRYAAVLMSDAPHPRSAAVLGVAASLLLAACSAASGATPSGGYTFSPPRVLLSTPNPSGPFVVVAVDDHFHDIHPSDPPTIAANRPFIVKNEGYNLHNFSVVGTNISIDIKPGHEFVWPTIGAHLKPGAYQIVCIYHAWEGMTGRLFVAPPNPSPSSSGQGG